MTDRMREQLDLAWLPPLQARFARAANSYIRPCRYFQFSRTHDDFQRGLRQGSILCWVRRKAAARILFVPQRSVGRRQASKYPGVLGVFTGRLGSTAE